MGIQKPHILHISESADIQTPPTFSRKKPPTERQCKYCNTVVKTTTMSAALCTSVYILIQIIICCGLRVRLSTATTSLFPTTHICQDDDETITASTI